MGMVKIKQHNFNEKICYKCGNIFIKDTRYSRVCNNCYFKSIKSTGKDKNEKGGLVNGKRGNKNGRRRKILIK